MRVTTTSAEERELRPLFPPSWPAIMVMLTMMAEDYTMLTITAEDYTMLTMTAEGSGLYYADNDG